MCFEIVLYFYYTREVYEKAGWSGNHIDLALDCCPLPGTAAGVSLLFIELSSSRQLFSIPAAVMIDGREWASHLTGVEPTALFMQP